MAEKKGWLQRSLDLKHHEAWRVALGVALGTFAGFAPLDSGLFAFAAFLMVFSEASGVPGLAVATVTKVLALTALGGTIHDLGHSLDATPGATQEMVYGLPLVALLGLERYAVAGGLVVAAAAAPVLALATFLVQRRIHSATLAADKKERKKREKREWVPNVRGRASDEVKSAVRPIKKWVALAVVIAVVQLGASSLAGRWLLESVVPDLIAEELGSCQQLHAGSVDASIFGARLRARDVVVVTDHARATIPDLEVQLDFIGLLRRRLVAKYVGVRGGKLVLERGAWPLPARLPTKHDDRNEALASRPRWSIGKGEVEDLEVEDRTGESPLVRRIKTAELSEIVSRDKPSSFAPPELHARGEGFALDLVDGARPTVARTRTD
jgi:uncharacterized protein (DUF2062 family)